MFNRYLTYYEGARQFVVFCAVLSMCWLLGSILSNTLYVQFTGYNAQQISDFKVIPPQVGNSLRWVTPLLLLLMFLLPALLFAYLAFPTPLRYLGFNQPNKPYYWLYGVTLLCIALPFTNWLEHWNANLNIVQRFKDSDAEYGKLAEAILGQPTTKNLWMNLLSVCLLPALMEEVFFRGCLQQLFMNWFGKYQWLVLVLVAALFSAIHIQWGAFFPRFALGLLLGLVYYFTNSIWITVLMHFVNNAFIVVLLYLSGNNMIQFNVLQPPATPIWAAIASALCSLGFLYWFYKHRSAFTVYEVDKTSDDPLTDKNKLTP